jgi:hypothetical protein
MSKILVHREGSQYGPYEEEEVRQFIYAGNFRDSDLAWREGLASWVPLAVLLAPAPPAAAGPAPSSSTALPASYPVYTRPYAETSPLAIASLVLGLLSLLGCMIVTAIPGVICGHLALSKIRQSRGYVTGEGVATAGLVTNYVALFLTLVALLFFLIIPMVFAIGIPVLDAL